MLPAVPTYLICRYGLADEGFVKRKRKQLLVEMKQPGGEPAPGMMDYVDPLRALEAMGARDIKVGKWDSQGIREIEGGWNTRQDCIALPWFITLQ